MESSEKEKIPHAKLSSLIRRRNSLNSWMSIQLILHSSYFILIQTFQSFSCWQKSKISVCLKKKGKDNEGKFRRRALLISYSATGYMSGLVILLQQGEHNAASQRCSKYPPTLLISRVCASEDRLWSLDWVSALLSAPFPSLTVEFFI